METSLKETEPDREVVAHEKTEEDEDTEGNDELHSIPESLTPRPRKPPQTPAGTKIGSGATPSFQPVQGITPLNTDVASAHHHPSKASRSSSYNAMNHSPVFSNSATSDSKSAQWTPLKPMSHAASGQNTPFSPQYAQDGFVQSPAQWTPPQHQSYSGSGQVTPYAPFTPQYPASHHQGPNSVSWAGPSGPQHANYPHASRYSGPPSQGSSPYASRETSGQVTPLEPKIHLPAHQGPKFRREPTKPSHTNSKTWTSPRAEEQERWVQVEENLRNMELIPRSPFVPHNFEQWLEHRVGRLEDGREETERKSKIQHENAAQPIKVAPAFGGKNFNDGRGAILGQKTIWHQPFDESKMDRPVADWPTQDEMREEGDERNTSRFGRFLGLPRSPGNNTVNWKVKPHVKPTSMDSVWELPTKKSYEESRQKWEGFETNTLESFLGKSLMEGLECEPEYKY